MRVFAVLMLASMGPAALAQEDPQQEVERLRRYLDGYITQNQQLRSEKEAAERRANLAEAQLRNLQAAPAAPLIVAPAPRPAAVMPYIPPLQMNVPQPQTQIQCSSRNVLGTVYTDCR